MPRKKGFEGVMKEAGSSYSYQELEKIRKRAFMIWEKKGKPKGSAVNDWHEAETQLKEEREIL